MKRLLWFLLVVAVAIAVMPAAATGDAFGTLSVRAVDQDGAPIANLRVTITETSASYDVVNRQWTNAAGEVSFTLPPGSYKVRFACLDCADLYLEEWFDDKPSFDTATVVTVPDSGAVHLDAALQIGGFITGRITDHATGLPVQAVPMLSVEDFTKGMSSSDWRANSDGFYQISGIATGTYHLSVDRTYDGYLATWYDGHYVMSDADPIHVTAGDTVSGIDFALVEGGSIAGTLYSDATGLPVRDGVVSAFHVETGRSYEFGLTGADGRYRIIGLPPGSYTVRVEVWDGIHLREWYVDSPSQDTATPIVMGFGEVITGIDVSLASNHFIDDSDSVFHGDIEWLAGVGITKGCNPPANTRFCPNDDVTRGQMAAFLVRALGLTDRLVDAFADDDDSIFEADIERLAAAGITKGCNPPINTMFCPDHKVSRGHMAAFLVRALGYTDDGGGDIFVDDDDSIFEHDIDCLATAQVTKGCNPADGNTMYCPDQYVTRGQMAAFLHRALG